jgi:tyrosyl-tRNA synthetase
MSKSLGNYIGITDPPDEMFGKIMSVSDELMWRYFELLSFRPMNEIDGMRQRVADGANPRDVKFELGVELVSRFHSGPEAEQARQAFIDRFQKGALPDDIPECELPGGGEGLPIANALKDAGLVASTSEGIRMIRQGAVRLDGQKVEDRGLVLATGSDVVCQVGKRKFARIRVR